MISSSVGENLTRRLPQPSRYRVSLPLLQRSQSQNHDSAWSNGPSSRHGPVLDRGIRRTVLAVGPAWIFIRRELVKLNQSSHNVSIGLTSLGKPPTNSLQLFCSKIALLSSGLSTSSSTPPTSWWTASIEQSLAVDQSLSMHSAVDCVLSSSSTNLNFDSNLLSRSCGREMRASIAGSCQISIEANAVVGNMSTSR